MTLAQAKQIGRDNGFTIRHKDGEYRVNLIGGTEDTAYYTTDRDDAVHTGIAMREHVIAKPAPTYRICWDALSLPGFEPIPKFLVLFTLEAANNLAAKLIDGGFVNVSIRVTNY